VADFGFAEVGHGILARFRLRSVGSGVSALTLLPAQLKKPVNANLPIGLVQNGTEAQDEACPNPADMAKLGIDMSALPASVPVSTSIDFPISETIQNQGPGNPTDVAVVKNTLAAVEDPVPGPGGPCDDAVDNGPDTLTDLADPDCQVLVSFHVAAPDMPVLVKVEVDTDGNGTLDLTAPPPAFVIGQTFVGYKIVTTKNIPLTVAMGPTLVVQQYDVHCLVPSTHALKKTNTIANLSLLVTFF